VRAHVQIDKPESNSQLSSPRCDMSAGDDAPQPTDDAAAEDATPSGSPRAADEPEAGGDDDAALLAAVSDALGHKERGNAAFKSGDNDAAVAAYADGLVALKAYRDAHADSDDDADKASATTPAQVEEREVRVSLHLNSAMALLKLEQWEKALASSKAALDVQPENVKALYRKGVAGARLGRVDGAVVDLQKALKLEPANRDAKRELARLTDIVRRKRLEEKKRFSGGLQRATSKGLYGDKEAEREKKKKLEAQASAKKRARHEKFNAARKEKGEDEVTFENWEKEEKEKAEKEEKAAEEARRRQQRQREEQRRKERGEDRVVVDDDLDLANCKGYKTLADGRRTSYFTNVPDQTTAQLLAAQQAPKKLEGGAAPSPDSNGDGSAWNAAGTTFEERDMKGWADDALRDALRDVSSVTDGLSVKTTSVKKLTGEASLVVSRGRARHIFEYVADLSVECRLPGEAPPGPGATTIKGTLHMPEVSSSITDGQYEARFLRKSSSPSLSRPREAALEAAVAAYSDAVRAAVAAFVADFSEKRIK